MAQHTFAFHISGDSAMSDTNLACFRATEREPFRILDPDTLFRIRYRRAVSCSDRLEYIAYKILPYNLLRSFVLTFDPTWKFRLSPAVVTPVNRTRTLSSVSVLDFRQAQATRRVRNRTIQTGVFPLCNPAKPIYHSTDQQSSLALTSQGRLKTVISDTTRRTRPIGSDQGEFELFKFTPLSPEKRIFRTVTRFQQYSVAGCPGCVINAFFDDRMTGTITPSGATFSSANIDALRVSSLAEINGIMSNRIDNLLARTLPSSRRLTIFRSVAELKDLPRSVVSLQQAVRLFSQSIRHLPKDVVRIIYSATASKQVPAQYLSYWFGWRLLYNDAVNMLFRPKLIAKEVNYLLQRRGKPTTFRTITKELGSVTTTPGWDYGSPNTLLALNETLPASNATVTSHTREHELRLVLNATFDFPHVGVPALKNQLFLEKIGLSPSASDLYNLIPWTWLLDWFTGLGNYIDLVDTINRADDLYNWGFLTGITHGKIETVRTSYTDSTHTNDFQGVQTTVVTRNNFRHSSVLEYHTQVRKDIVNAYDVKSTTDPSSLTVFQQSIIGAIIASYRGK